MSIKELSPIIILIITILLAFSIYKKPFIEASQEEKPQIIITAGLFTLIASSLFIFAIGNNHFYNFVNHVAQSISGK